MVIALVDRSSAPSVELAIRKEQLGGTPQAPHDKQWFGV
jgi:hypothetical protein